MTRRSKAEKNKELYGVEHPKMPGVKDASFPITQALLVVLLLGTYGSARHELADLDWWWRLPLWIITGLVVLLVLDWGAKIAVRRERYRIRRAKDDGSALVWDFEKGDGYKRLNG